MMSIFLVAAIVFFCVIIGISSATLTGRNDSMIVESFSSRTAKASKAPKAPKA